MCGVGAMSWSVLSVCVCVYENETEMEMVFVYFSFSVDYFYGGLIVEQTKIIGISTLYFRNIHYSSHWVRTPSAFSLQHQFYCFVFIWYVWYGVVYVCLVFDSVYILLSHWIGLDWIGSKTVDLNWSKKYCKRNTFCAFLFGVFQVDLGLFSVYTIISVLRYAWKQEQWTCVHTEREKKIERKKNETHTYTLSYTSSIIVQLFEFQCFVIMWNHSMFLIPFSSDSKNGKFS